MPHRNVSLKLEILTISGIEILLLVILEDPAYTPLSWLMKPYPDTGALTRQQ